MILKNGELAALITAFSWTAAAMIFETASKRLGVLAVNTLKVFLGTFYLAFLALIVNHQIFPFDASLKSWIYMSASGIIGFVVGDYFLFHSYIFVGSRIGMLLMSASVPMTAIASYFIFGEAIRSWGLLGITLTVSGIIVTVLAGNGSSKKSNTHAISKDVYAKGILFGFLSAVAMTAGTLLTKVGAENMSAIAATQLRIFSAFVGFVFVVIFFRKYQEVFNAAKNPSSLRIIALGSIFGPFVGVGCLLYALQNAPAGIVSTISSLTPVLIIIPSIIIFKRHVRVLEIAGAVVAFMGIALLFL